MTGTPPRRCQRCETEQPAAARFCGSCGARLEPSRGAPRRFPRLRRARLIAALGVAATIVALSLAVPPLAHQLSPSGGTEAVRKVSAADGATLAVGSELALRIPAGGLAEDATVVARKVPAAGAPSGGGLDAAAPVGALFSITADQGKLVRRLTIELAFDPALLPKDSPRGAVFAAYYDEARQRWVPAGGTVDARRNVVVVESDHLSLWQVRAWDVRKLADKISLLIESVLRPVGLRSADLPRCGGPTPIRMTYQADASFLVCVEEAGADDHALVRVANNRYHAVLLDPPAQAQLQGASIDRFQDALWDAIVDRTTQDVVYLSPGAEARFALRFDRPGEARFVSQPSYLTLAGDLLLSLVDLLGLDEETVLAASKCAFTSVARGGADATAGDLWVAVRECIGVVAKGALGVAWSVVRNIVTLVPALTQVALAGITISERGSLVVTYQPPRPVAKGPEDATQSGDPSRTGIDGFVRIGRQGVASIRVEVLSVGGQVIATGVTGTGGYFRVPGVAPGSYRVNVPAQADYLSSFGGAQVRGNEFGRAVGTTEANGEVASDAIQVWRAISGTSIAVGATLTEGTRTISWDPVPQATHYCVLVFNTSLSSWPPPGNCDFLGPYGFVRTPTARFAPLLRPGNHRLAIRAYAGELQVAHTERDVTFQVETFRPTARTTIPPGTYTVGRTTTSTAPGAVGWRTILKSVTVLSDGRMRFDMDVVVGSRDWSWAGRDSYLVLADGGVLLPVIGQSVFYEGGRGPSATVQVVLVFPGATADLQPFTLNICGNSLCYAPITGLRLVP